MHFVRGQYFSCPLRALISNLIPQYKVNCSCFSRLAEVCLENRQKSQKDKIITIHWPISTLGLKKENEASEELGGSLKEVGIFSDVTEFGTAGVHYKIY